MSTDPISGADHKKSGFWNKVALLYNRYAPEGATIRTSKILNARWNRASPLVSKFSSSVSEAYRINPSGANEDMIMQLAHQGYQNKVGKTFNLMHWWLLLKDAPKWESMCDEGIEVVAKRIRVNEMGAYSDSSSSSTPTTSGTPSTPITPASEDTPTEEGGGLLRPIGRKAAKRKAKEKVDDPYVERLTTELGKLGTSTVEKNSMLAKYVELQQEKMKQAEKAMQLRDQYQAFKAEEQRIKVMKYEDKILQMNIAQMCPEDRARYGPLQEQIRSRYRQGGSSS